VTPVIDVVSGLCVRADGALLMGLRPPGKPRPHLWELPGGRVEPGESREAALRREWREELGVEIEVRPGRVAVDSLRVEMTVVIHLYRVVFDPRTPPRALHHVLLDWVRPEHAVVHLPCSPGYYVQYRSILADLEDRRAPVDRIRVDDLVVDVDRPTGVAP